MRLNVCMLGPSGVGKTSMITAIFMDAKNKLISHPSKIKIFPESDETRERIEKAIAQFEHTLRLDSNEIGLIAGNATLSEYKFRFHIPDSPQPVDVKILDYPGGWLGTDDFQLIEKHVQDSLATLVPIPADVLLEWYRNFKKNPNNEISKFAETVLCPNKVCAAIKNWIESRQERTQKSLLMFVPIRCEHCFSDNGGDGDQGVDLQNAVKEMYLSRLDIPNETVQTEIRAIDTYGVVELQQVTWKEQRIWSNFRRREVVAKAKPKGAYEVLSRIILFKMEEYADLLHTSIGDLEETISQRGFLKKFFIALLGDKEKAMLNSLEAEEVEMFVALKTLNDVTCDDMHTYDSKRTKIIQ